MSGDKLNVPVVVVLPNPLGLTSLPARHLRGLKHHIDEILCNIGDWRECSSSVAIESGLNDTCLP
jgi:hypothetical protein